MSVEHVKEYYDQVCNQYMEMVNEIKDFEEEAKKGLIEPERLDQIKESIKPLMINYQTLSWIMFLLNKPVKKSKHKRYMNQNKKFIETFKVRDKDTVLNENDQVIGDLNKIIKGK